MHSTAHITAVLLAFATAVVSSPVELQRRSAFTIEQVPVKAVYRKHGAQQKLVTYQKYGIPVEASLAASAKKVAAKTTLASTPSSGSVSAWIDESQESYLTPITIGKDTLHVVFDTASSDLWVESTLQSQEQTWRHDIYHADQSKIKKGYTWNISYGDHSSAYGDVYVDRAQAGPMVVPKQAFGAAKNVSAEFLDNFQMDGLLGLAFRKINSIKPVQQNTFFENLKPNLAAPLFATALRSNAPGTYDFGFIDQSKYKGTLAYTEVDSSSGHWKIYVTGSSMLNYGFHAIVDSGSTLALLQPEYVDAYWAKVPHAVHDDTAGGYIFPCDADLPDFWLKIGGAKHVISGDYLNNGYMDDSGVMCFGALQSNNGFINAILGQTFMKGRYIVHEDSNGLPRMGLARLAHL